MLNELTNKAILMNQDNHAPQQSELGKKSDYYPHYDPTKLFPILRKSQRDKLSLPEKLPFYGVDIWNHYEVSWLNEKGKPIAALAEIIYSCASPYLIESKSMKLYFNSFNNTVFRDAYAVENTVKKDIAERIQSEVQVKITPLSEVKEKLLYPALPGQCIDDLDIECSLYEVKPELLHTEKESVEETVFSNLLKSNCLVTSQPDWGSIQIQYKGRKINHADLLRYIISFRNHQEFHEHCIERIFVDIMQYCKPEKLTVYGRYTRRGGLDINPLRSTEQINHVKNTQLCRQ